MPEIAQDNSLLGWGWSHERPLPPGLGRIIREHKGGYGVVHARGEALCVVSGKLRRAIEQKQAPRPVPGDWVTLELQPGNRAIISEVIARKSFLRRRSPTAGEQTMGANIDTLIVVMAVTQDFNLRRLERYLAIAKDGSVTPALFLTKADLATDAEDRKREAEALVRTVLVSQVTGQGLAEAAALLAPGRTYALLGSSGVGKSTLVNRWLSEQTQATNAIRDDGKGRHTTTHRTLFRLPSGAIVMDSPGMRELGVTDDASGIQESFEDIAELANTCRFSDCQHAREPGCAVQAALVSGALDPNRFTSYEKLKRERGGVAESRHARQRKR